MNFGFSEEQEFLRTTAREFLAKESPMTAVRALMDDPRGYTPDVWAKMAELGWLGLLLPEEYGGAELSVVDLFVVAEELGRALTPPPFFANLQGSLAVLHGGTDAQRKEILPEVAAGRRVLSFAITEESGPENADEIATRATRTGSSWTLAGTKLSSPTDRAPTRSCSRPGAARRARAGCRSSWSNAARPASRHRAEKVPAPARLQCRIPEAGEP